MSRKRPGVLSHWGLQKPGGGNSHLETSRADAINPLNGQVSTHLELWSLLSVDWEKTHQSGPPCADCIRRHYEGALRWVRSSPTDCILDTSGSRRRSLALTARKSCSCLQPWNQTERLCTAVWHLYNFGTGTPASASRYPASSRRLRAQRWNRTLHNGAWV